MAYIGAEFSCMTSNGKKKEARSHLGHPIESRNPDSGLEICRASTETVSDIILAFQRGQRLPVGLQTVSIRIPTGLQLRLFRTSFWAFQREQRLPVGLQTVSKQTFHKLDFLYSPFILIIYSCIKNIFSYFLVLFKTHGFSFHEEQRQAVGLQSTFTFLPQKMKKNEISLKNYVQN